MDSKDNVLDYMDWRGDLSFSCAGINEVDSLIFSIFAYLDYPFVNSSPMTIAAAADRIFSSPDKNRYCSISFIAKNAFALLDKAHSSTRYKDVVITSFRDISDESRQMQFSAVTFLINDEKAFIAFRGTDESIIGWKEDLNMSFSYPTGSYIHFNSMMANVAHVPRFPDNYSNAQLAGQINYEFDGRGSKFADENGKVNFSTYLNNMYVYDSTEIKELIDIYNLGMANANWGIQFYQNVTGSFINIARIKNVPMQEYWTQNRNVEVVPEVGTEDFYEVARTNLIYGNGAIVTMGIYQPNA